jgi:hypothetical protein
MACIVDETVPNLFPTQATTFLPRFGRFVGVALLTD